MARFKDRNRLRTKIKNILVNAELEGISQRDLTRKTITYNRTKNPNGFKRADIITILQDWKNRGMAQRFDIRVGYSKKPTRMWRATQSILTKIL